MLEKIPGTTLDFQEGMNRTYRAFRGVYGQRK